MSLGSAGISAPMLIARDWGIDISRPVNDPLYTFFEKLPSNISWAIKWTCLQLPLNFLNGITDIPIDLLNFGIFAINTLSWAMDFDDSLSYIPSWNWAEGIAAEEWGWVNSLTRMIGGGLGMGVALKTLAKINLIPEMVVAVGKGNQTIPRIPGKHFAYNLNGTWMHGNGERFFQMKVSHLFENPKLTEFWTKWLENSNQYNIPVLFPRLAGIVAKEGQWAIACFEVPLRATLFGNSPILLVPITHTFITDVLE
jgi:hypothetical protein